MRRWLWVMCSPYKHEGMNQIPKCHRHGSHAYDPSSGEAEADKFPELTVKPFLSYQQAPKPKERPCLKKKERNDKHSNSHTNAHTCAYVPTHTQACRGLHPHPNKQINKNLRLNFWQCYHQTILHEKQDFPLRIYLPFKKNV